MPSRHVVQNRLLGQIKTDHVRHEGIDGLVVGDAGPDRVGERDAAGAIRGEQPRHAQDRVGAERPRIEKIVIDPAVQDVNAARTAGRAHVHGIVLHEQILALDQLDTHLLGEESVFEICRVVRARREQGHFGPLLSRRRDAAEVLE